MDNSYNWQWQTVAGNTYLTCNLLSSWQHGFFTQDFYPQTPEQLTTILQPGTKAYRVKQVHGHQVLTAQEITTAMKAKNLTDWFPDGDGVISNQSHHSVWVASADCTPVLIGDLQTGAVCAIHAGWRGTAQKIVAMAIARLLEMGSQQDQLRVAIGPAIAGVMYQVDLHVAIAVGKTIINDVSSKTDAEILTELQNLPDSPLTDDELPGKVRLNIPKINQIQLEKLNIPSKHIAIAPFCTYQTSDLFFSYRRTGEKKIQWSGIVPNSTKN